MKIALFVLCVVAVIAALARLQGRLREAIEPPEDVQEPPEHALDHGDGLRSVVLAPGSGATHPGPTQRVTVHYTGWTTDGQMFDSSVVRGRPATFPLDGVIEGWQRGVALMVEGERRRLWIPQAMAYPRGGGPAGMLVFDVELLSLGAP